MNPKLSVIIPIYKVEDYLDRCVMSVLNQDYRDLEVILVDDGSPDRCPQICDEFARKDARVRVFHKKNGGLSSARNKGIEEAKGKYLAFLDSDDQWADGRLKEVMNLLSGHEVEMLLFDTIDIYNGGIKMKRNNHGLFDNSFKVLDKEAYYSELIRIGDLHESACTKIILREFLIKNNLSFSYGITGEDTEWMFRLLRCITRVAISNVELFLCTNSRVGSIQNSIRAKNIWDLIGTIDKSLAYYSEHNDAPIKKYELEHCAYLVANATGLLRYIDDRNEKRELIEALRQKTFLFGYCSNYKTKKVKLANKIFGYDGLVRILDMYLCLKKKNIVSRKRKINE